MSRRPSRHTIPDETRPRLGRPRVKVAVDTNVLVHAVMRDDPAQADIAAKVLTEVQLIAVAMPCLCEFV